MCARTPQCKPVKAFGLVPSGLQDNPALFACWNVLRFGSQVSGKTASLPIQPNYTYQQQMAHYGQTHTGGYSSHPNTPPSQHWSPGHRPHPHPQFGSNQSSPQRTLPPQQGQYTPCYLLLLDLQKLQGLKNKKKTGKKERQRVESVLSWQEVPSVIQLPIYQSRLLRAFSTMVV